MRLECNNSSEKENSVEKLEFQLNSIEMVSHILEKKTNSIPTIKWIRAHSCVHHNATSMSMSNGFAVLFTVYILNWNITMQRWIEIYQKYLSTQESEEEEE